MIYAWCVRDVICKYSGYIALDEKLSLKDKKAFEALMNGWVDTAEINGQLFKYDDDKPIQDVKISQPALLVRKSTVTYELSSQQDMQGRIISAREMGSVRGDINSARNAMNLPSAGVGVDMSFSSHDLSGDEEVAKQKEGGEHILL